MKLVSIGGSREVLGRNAAVKMLLQKFNEENGTYIVNSLGKNGESL